MGIKEFELSFDVLYNNISSNQAPSLNSYEKSVFLTRAQEEKVKVSFFSSGEGLKGFDGNQKSQIDFSFLMTDADADYAGSSSSIAGVHDPRALIFDLPDGIMFIVNEAIYFTNSNNSLYAMRQVVPISYDEYTRLMQKPYKEPYKNQAWRLLVQKGTVGHRADIILHSADIMDYIGSDLSSIDDKVRYAIRYVRYPKPIILTNLHETYGPTVNIHGEYEPISPTVACELDESVHEEILQRAVELAKASWAG